MTGDNDTCNECEGQNDRREIMALLEICGLIHDYPIDFRKSEKPDWMNYRVGLEVTSVATKNERKRFNLADKKDEPLGQLRIELRDMQLDALCEFTEGERKGRLFFYRFCSEQIINYENITSYRDFDSLSPEDRKERDSAKIINFLPLELDDQVDQLTRILRKVEEKLRKLQSYELCDEYHLHIASTWHLDRRLLRSIMDAMNNRTDEIAGESGRRYDRIFLSTDEAMCIFDLRVGKFGYICRRNITDEEYNSVIVPPG